MDRRRCVVKGHVLCSKSQTMKEQQHSHVQEIMTRNNMVIIG